MPYPMDFRSPRKQPGAGESTASGSQGLWSSAPDFVGIGIATIPEDTVSNDFDFDTDPSNNKPQRPRPARRHKRCKTPVERERELNYALVAAHRNLTRISQYMLKLEARANLATQEDMRLTCEATVDNQEHSSRDLMTETDDGGDYHARLIEDVDRISGQVWKRMFRLDKDFTRMSRKNRREEGGKSGPIQLRGESHTKNWLEREQEKAANGLLEEETLFYTVRDMMAGRPLTEWFGYIRDLVHGMREEDGPSTLEYRIVAVAWSFLDRAIRPPRPRFSTTVTQFIAKWDSLRRGGAFDRAREEPERQRESDAEVLESLKDLWSARHKPL
ncbi:hypothetical protein PG996_013396 [Apiospora saccharicola]|uniref:Uncharacterized protein n=1 Tax=Apiospora saccharicola TaxID=335842 RepID=A0ABR1U7P6_9PEZI